MSPMEVMTAPAIVAAKFDLPLLSSLFDDLPNSVVILGADCRSLFLNKAAQWLAGDETMPSIGREAAELLGFEDRSEFLPIADRIRTGSTVKWSGWVGYPGGVRRFVEYNFAPCHNEIGDFIAMICFMRDQTELKKREEELASKTLAHLEAENINAEIVRSGLDPIIVTDERGCVLTFNPAAESLFGYSSARAVGKPIADLIIPDEHRAAHRTGMDRHRRTGESRVLGKRLELEAIDAQGTKFPVELAIGEVKLPDRRLYTAHLRDLRPAKKAAQQIEQQRDRIHQIQKLSAMGSLLAGVAHELNNPLAILLAQSTLLLETAPADGVRKRAERIHAAAERAGRIIKSFLAMARQKPPSRTRVDFNALARETLEVVAYGLRAAGITVATELEPDLPALMVDEDLFRQVIANLVINAQQALSQSPGPRKLLVRTCRSMEFVAIEIADNGPGVPAELAERIFDPFFTTKPAGVGTGIGLAICSDVVKAHGGRIEHAEQAGGGALFRVLVPLASAGLGDGDLKAPAEELRCERILVVDDEPDVGESLADILDLVGHQAEVMVSARDALEQLKTEVYTRVFVDLRMPEMNGDAFIEQLAADQPSLAARSVLMTGDTVRGPATLLGARAAALGVKVLEKPFNIEDVQRVLE